MVFGILGPLVFFFLVLWIRGSRFFRVLLNPSGQNLPHYCKPTNLQKEQNFILPFQKFYAM